MMSINQIAAMLDEQARHAARAKKTPYVPFDAKEIEGYRAFPFPNIGSYRPKGWKLVETFMCDSSGMGDESEPALTIRQLKARLLLDLDKGYGYAIVAVGQFQVVLGAFQKTMPRSRK